MLAGSVVAGFGSLCLFSTLLGRLVLKSLLYCKLILNGTNSLIRFIKMGRLCILFWLPWQPNSCILHRDMSWYFLLHHSWFVCICFQQITTYQQKYATPYFGNKWNTSKLYSTLNSMWLIERKNMIK